MNGLLSERAISDVVAFTLTFSVILTGVGFAYVAGFDALENSRDNEYTSSASRTMQGIAETFEDIHRESAPTRSIEFSVDRGDIRLADSTLGVDVQNSGVSESIDVGSLVYEPTDGSSTVVTYEGGAAFWVQQNGSLSLHRPVLRCSDNVALVSFVRLVGDVDIGNIGGVRITADRVESETRTIYPNPVAGQRAEDAHGVVLDVRNSANEDQWDRYLRPADGWESIGSGQFECDVDNDQGRVFVRVTTIEISAVY